jgi:DNA-binding CsgD family transcriptional regulator
MTRKPGLGGLSNSEIEHVVALGESGETYARISEQTGVPVSLVNTILMGAGVKPMLIRRAQREKRVAEIARQRANARATVSPRDQEMISLRRAGSTLDEIGQRFDITRERVRQILKKHNVPDPAEARRATRLVQEQEARALGQKIERWVREHPGCTVPELSFALTLDEKSIDACIPRTCAHLIVLPEMRNKKNMVPRRWTRAEVLDAIRTAAATETPLSYVRYDEIRVSESINGPSAVRILQIFGTWSKACTEAGVQHGRRIRTSYQRRWTAEEMVEYLANFLRHSTTGSLDAYDKWAKEHDAPSGQTLRLQFGSWPEARTRANLLLRSLWTEH